MAERKRKTLGRDNLGIPIVPDPIPEGTQDLLDLMTDAIVNAARAQGGGAPVHDHAMSIFNLLTAHHQARVATQLAEAHQGLRRATNGLRVATWWLAGVTVILGLVEACTILGRVRGGP